MKLKAASLAILAFFIATLPFSHAYLYCQGNNLSEYSVWTMDGINHVYNQTSEVCQFGCDSQLLKCNPSTWQKNMGFVGDLGLFPMVLFTLILVLAVIVLLRRK